MVDDFSDKENLKSHLDDYVKQFNGKVGEEGKGGGGLSRMWRRKGVGKVGERRYRFVYIRSIMKLFII